MAKDKGVRVGLLLMSILFAVKTCVLNAGQDKNEEEARLIRQIGWTIREDKKNAETAIYHLIKNKGRIFLYTNDTLAHAYWAPDLEDGLSSPVKSVMLESQKYTDFVKNYDSLGFELIVATSGKTAFSLNKNLILNDGSTKKRLYFMGYDSKDNLPKDASGQRRFPETSNQKFTTAWGMGYKDVSGLSVDSLYSLPFIACTLFLQQVDGFYFYMAGVEKDNNHPGIDSMSFMGSVKVLKKALKESGADTRDFHVKIFPGMEH